MNHEPDIVDSGSVEVEPVAYTQEQLDRALFSLQSRQNLPLALIAGLVAGGLGAAVWAVITVVTQFQIGWLAVGIGFMVGVAVRTFGNGMTTVYGFTGGAISLASVLLGNFFSMLGLVAIEMELPFLSVLTSFDYSQSFELMKATFSPIDLLFYAIAVWEGYKFSFREVKSEDIQQQLELEGIQPTRR